MNKNNLKALRIKNGLSQQKLADLAGVTLRQIQHLEAGTRKISTIKMLNSLMTILNCTAADIIGYDNLGIKPVGETRYISPDPLANKIATASGEVTPKLKKLQNILLTKEQEPIEVKVFTQEFACGAGSEPLNYESYTPTIFLRGILKELFPSVKSIIGVRASGDSMLPFINDKDIVFVDTSKNTFTPHKKPNKSIYAFRHDNMLCIKQLVNHPKEPHILNAISFNNINNNHPTFTINLKNNSHFSIIGKVVGVFGKI